MGIMRTSSAAQSVPSAYHRRRWRRFAERWDESAMTVMEALQLLHMHKRQVHGIGKAPGRRWRPPKTPDELAPGIVRKLEMFLASEEVSDAQRAADEAEWARRGVADLAVEPPA
jgi:hypothetical protein